MSATVTLPQPTDQLDALEQQASAEIADAPDAQESASVTGLSVEDVNDFLDDVAENGVLSDVDVALVAGLLLRMPAVSKSPAPR